MPGPKNSSYSQIVIDPNDPNSGIEVTGGFTQKKKAAQLFINELEKLRAELLHAYWNEQSRLKAIANRLALLESQSDDIVFIDEDMLPALRQSQSKAQERCEGRIAYMCDLEVELAMLLKAKNEIDQKIEPWRVLQTVQTANVVTYLNNQFNPNNANYNNLRNVVAKELPGIPTANLDQTIADINAGMIKRFETMQASAPTLVEIQAIRERHSDDKFVPATTAQQKAAQQQQLKTYASQNFMTKEFGVTTALAQEVLQKTPNITKSQSIFSANRILNSFGGLNGLVQQYQETCGVLQKDVDQYSQLVAFLVNSTFFGSLNTRCEEVQTQLKQEMTQQLNPLSKDVNHMENRVNGIFAEMDAKKAQSRYDRTPRPLQDAPTLNISRRKDEK